MSSSEQQPVAPAHGTQLPCNAMTLSPCFSSPSSNEKLPPIWDKIFKQDSTWLREMKELQEIKETILPTLVGWDLHNIMKSHKSAYLVLLVHDWSGELRYSHGALMDSLKSFKSISKSEVQILGDNITLNLAECLENYSKSEYITLRDPRKLFRPQSLLPLKHEALRKSLLYYGDDTIYDASASDIGGIEDIFSWGRGQIRDICSIRMKLADGKPVYRVFVRENMDRPLHKIMTKDEFGRQWVTGWKEAGSVWRV